MDLTHFQQMANWVNRSVSLCAGARNIVVLILGVSITQNITPFCHYQDHKTTPPLFTLFRQQIFHDLSCGVCMNNEQGTSLLRKTTKDASCLKNRVGALRNRCSSPILRRLAA